MREVKRDAQEMQGKKRETSAIIIIDQSGVGRSSHGELHRSLHPGKLAHKAFLVIVKRAQKYRDIGGQGSISVA